MAIWTAFLLGLTGSLHCLGMCGPLVLAVSSIAPRGQNILFNKIIYHAGRIGAYGIIGLIFGLLGKVISLAGWQQWLSILAGAGILIGLFAGFNAWSGHLVHRGIGWLKRRLSFFLQRKSSFSFLSMGFLNGFLPCGLVYVAGAASAATGAVFQSMLYMLAFGLGTAPLMLSASLSGNLLQPYRLKIRKTIPAVLFLIGVLLIIRGLSLGIPYLSPDLTNATDGHAHPHANGLVQNDFSEN